METATLIAIFLSGLIVSFTGYALYTAFGKPFKKLRDPLKENGASERPW
jgi:PsbN protein